MRWEKDTPISFYGLMFAVFSETKKMFTNDDGSMGFFPFQKGKHRTFLFFFFLFESPVGLMSAS